MKLEIPKEVLTVYQTLVDTGFATYLVGGSVRNILMYLPVVDWDFATSATPEEILKLFPDGFYDNVFGTVGVPLEKTENTTGKGIIEVTTFRTETGYTDKRHPEIVTWGKTIQEDLSRRDFTINAIAMELHVENTNVTPNIIDPFKGQKDIAEKIIRAVGNPKERFKEDALRLLRAVRLATVYQFTIEENTWKEIVTDALLLTHISAERIRDELLKILASDFPYEGTMFLKNAGLLQYILPELLEGIDVSQVRPGRHHTTDVFTHNILSLKHCSSKDPIVRLATLLHDVGKPKVAAVDQEGLVTFYNHELVGAKIARDITDKLRLSKKEREKIVILIRWHMFTVDEKITDAAVRRFIRRIGVENVQDMMDLRIGDRLGGGTQTAESWRLKLFKKRIEDQLKPLPFSINDLAIDGHDVMETLKMKPGPEVGNILQKLFEEVDLDLSKNTKAYLLPRIKEMHDTSKKS